MQLLLTELQNSPRVSQVGILFEVNVFVFTLSSRWSNQGGNFILTAGQLDRHLAINATFVYENSHDIERISLKAVQCTVSLID